MKVVSMLFKSKVLKARVFLILSFLFLILSDSFPLGNKGETKPKESETKEG
jgi:hypothetical protein